MQWDQREIRMVYFPRWYIYVDDPTHQSCDSGILDIFSDVYSVTQPPLMSNIPYMAIFFVPSIHLDNIICYGNYSKLIFVLKPHPNMYVVCMLFNSTKLSRRYFPTTPHPKPKLTPTFSQLLHNQTRPNSVCNLLSTQLEDSFKKEMGHPPPPKKNCY